MSQQFPNGTVFKVSTTLAAAVAISAISNANPGVASSTNPPTAGDIVVVNSAWPRLNQRVARAANVVASTSFELEGVDTTDTDKYPAAEGEGSFQVAGSFVALSQVTNVAKSGGEQQFYQWQYVEDPTGRQQQRPTFRNAKVLTLTLDYDPALAWYQALKDADEAKEPVVLMAQLPNGTKLYYLVYPAFDADPSMASNQNMQNTATFSLVSDFTRYAS